MPEFANKQTKIIGLLHLSSAVCQLQLHDSRYLKRTAAGGDLSWLNLKMAVAKGGCFQILPITKLAQKISNPIRDF